MVRPRRSATPQEVRPHEGKWNPERSAVPIGQTTVVGADKVRKFGLGDPAMARIWKAPYSREKYRESTGHWDDYLFWREGCIELKSGAWMSLPPDSEQKWIYYVEVCRFTFVFLSLEEICIYLDFYSEKGRGGSRWRADGRPHPEDEGQNAFSRLPLRLRKEPKRQKVVKALKRALDVFGREK